MRAELVFRDVPGKLVQRRGQAQWFGGFGLLRTLVDSPCDGVAGVAITPVCLGFLTSRRLAVGIPAGALAASHSRVGPEPPATDGARSLPGLGHRDDLSSSSRSVRGQVGGQFRVPGSFLPSRGGSILESAEAQDAFYPDRVAFAILSEPVVDFFVDAGDHEHLRSAFELSQLFVSRGRDCRIIDPVSSMWRSGSPFVGSFARQSPAHQGRLSRDDRQIGPCGRIRLPAALLPLLKGPLADAVCLREFRL